MSEGASARPTDASQASQASHASAGGPSAADQGAVAADTKATGDAIDEMLAANDPVKNSNSKRAYPEPNFPIERSGAVGGKGSYTNRFKLNAAACTREICPCDGQCVRNNSAGKVLGVTQKRIIEWLKQEEQLREKVSANPKLSKAKQVHGGGKASTVDVKQALVDYINEHRKQHRGCGNQEVMRKLLELKPDALGGMPTNAKPEEALAFKVKFNSWYQWFRKRNGFSIRRRTSVGQKVPKGYEGRAWATVMKVREDLVKRALASVEVEVFEELGNMDQTPVQHEMPVETTLEKTGAKDARISTGGKEKGRFTLVLAVMADGEKVSPRIIFKGTPFIPPAVRGKGKNTLPRKNSVAWEILPANRAKHGHPDNGMSFGVQERSWSNQRECNGWISGSWKLRPNNGSIVQQRPCILVLDDFKCHKDERMKRLLWGMYTAYGASAVADVRSGKPKPPGRGVVSTWCNEALAFITPETVKTCFKICGLTLALDGREDHAAWLAEHPDVTLPPLKLPKVPERFDSNPITAAQKEVEGKLLSYVADESDSEVEVLAGDSDVEVVEGQGGGGAEGEVVEL
eukprot:g13494.t1